MSWQAAKSLLMPGDYYLLVYYRQVRLYYAKIDQNGLGVWVDGNYCQQNYANTIFHNCGMNQFSAQH